jgi:hypothetical protein
MAPIFYLAIGRDPRRRDLALCLDVGQRDFLVPAGTRRADLIRRTPGIRYVYDSGAWPIDNPGRISIPTYAKRLIEASEANFQSGPIDQRAWFDWGATYDHILSREATERDAAELHIQVGGRDIGIVPIVHYPWATADDIIGQAIADLEMLDDDEVESFLLGQHLGEVIGPPDWPAVGIGGLVPTHYSREAAYWLDTLMDELGDCAERFASGQHSFDFGDGNIRFSAKDLDPFLRRVHLFGVAKPSWVLHPSGLCYSCDSSGPFQMAKYGWEKARTAPFEKYGYTADKLQKSREARLTMHLCHYRDRLGLPYSPIDEELLLDDTPSRVFPSIGIRAVQASLDCFFFEHVDEDGRPAMAFSS